MKNPKRKETMSWKEVKGYGKNEETSRPKEEATQKNNIGEQPS
jgi:hypothetical protein